MKLFQGLRAHILLLLITLALVGCDSSELTAFNTHATVVPNGDVEVTVDQHWVFAFQEFDNTDEDWTMVFVLGLPPGWDVSDTVEFEGDFGASSVAVTLDRLPGPPPGNMQNVLGGSELEFYEDTTCSDPANFPGNLTPVFFQATTPFTVNSEEDDLGEFSFTLYAGSQHGTFDFLAAHGLYNTFTDPQGQIPDENGCWYFAQPPNQQGGDPIINSVTAQIAVIGAALGTATVAVPVGGAWLALLMALGLIGTGMWFGWRRDRASKT